MEKVNTLSQEYYAKTYLTSEFLADNIESSLLRDILGNKIKQFVKEVIEKENVLQSEVHDGVYITYFVRPRPKDDMSYTTAS